MGSPKFWGNACWKKWLLLRLKACVGRQKRSVWHPGRKKYLCRGDPGYAEAIAAQSLEIARTHPRINPAFKLVFLTASIGTLLFTLICVGGTHCSRKQSYVRAARKDGHRVIGYGQNWLRSGCGDAWCPFAKRVILSPPHEDDAKFSPCYAGGMVKDKAQLKCKFLVRSRLRLSTGPSLTPRVVSVSRQRGDRMNKWVVAGCADS
jgi:hypothetical protein